MWQRSNPSTFKMHRNAEMCCGNAALIRMRESSFTLLLIVDNDATTQRRRSIVQLSISPTFYEQGGNSQNFLGKFLRY